MGTGTLKTNYKNEDVFDPRSVNSLVDAWIGDIVGRDSQGRATPGKNAGNQLIPFKRGYFDELISKGKIIDFSSLAQVQNRIISGKQSLLSERPDFAAVGGDTSLDAKIMAKVENLSLSISGAAVSVTEDITVNMTAGFLSGDTCTIDDSGITADNGKHAGEVDFAHGDGKHGYITIDNAGAEITARINQYATFQTQGATKEVFLAYIASATRLEPTRRGGFFGLNGVAIEIQSLADNASLKILKTAWGFISSANPNSMELSYRSPFYSEVAPGRADAGTWWFRNSLGRWLRGDNATFNLVDAIPVAIFAATNTGCIAYQCLDFNKDFKGRNNVETAIASNDVVRMLNKSINVNVYGEEVKLAQSDLRWTFPTDLTRGATRLVSTRYFLYITGKLEGRIDVLRSQYRENLKGRYHPFEAWLCVGEYKLDTNGHVVELENYFPWQKYNSRGKIPQEFILSLQTSPPQVLAAPPVSPVEGSPSRRGAGRLEVNLKAGFFSTNFLVTGGIVTESRSIIALESPSTKTQLAIRITSTSNVDLDRISTITLGRAGNDAIQVELDNRLK